MQDKAEDASPHDKLLYNRELYSNSDEPTTQERRAVQSFIGNSISHALGDTFAETTLGIQLKEWGKEIKYLTTLRYRKDLITGREDKSLFDNDPEAFIKTKAVFDNRHDDFLEDKNIPEKDIPKRFDAALRPKLDYEPLDSGLELNLALLGTSLETRYIPFRNGVKTSLYSMELNKKLSSKIAISYSSYPNQQEIAFEICKHF